MVPQKEKDHLSILALIGANLIPIKGKNTDNEEEKG
jgi:hypothetical protein